MPSVNKFAAYKEIAQNYADAMDIMSRKQLVLGEPAIVPYYTDLENNEDDISLLLGIGSIGGRISIIEPNNTVFTKNTTPQEDEKYKIWYGSGNSITECLSNSTPFQAIEFLTFQILYNSKAYISCPENWNVSFSENSNQIIGTLEDELFIERQRYNIYSIPFAKTGEHTIRAFYTRTKD